MTRDEYQAFRSADFAQKIVGIDIELTKLNSGIVSLLAEISSTEAAASSSQALIQDTYARMESDYVKCASLGIHSELYCQDQKKPLYDAADLARHELDSWQAKLTRGRKLIADQKAIIAFYQSQKIVGRTLSDNIPHERGSFDPISGIKLTLDTIDNPRALADYFATLTHEYLHYTSFVSEGKKLSDPFFEEGLTEYYARMAIAKDLAVSTNLGYPAFVKIITKLAKNIPDSELADIYFTKDQSKLESVLNRVYGDRFYQDIRPVITALQYSSSPHQILPLANIIMDAIGGDRLTETDLLSTESILE